MESEEEEDEKSTIKSKGRRRSTKSIENGDKPKKKRVRKVKAKRGYYASSDEGEKEVEEVEGPHPAKKQRRKKSDVINEILAEVNRLSNLRYKYKRHSVTGNIQLLDF